MKKNILSVAMLATLLAPHYTVAKKPRHRKQDYSLVTTQNLVPRAHQTISSHQASSHSLKSLLLASVALFGLLPIAKGQLWGNNNNGILGNNGGLGIMNNLQQIEPPRIDVAGELHGMKTGGGVQFNRDTGRIECAPDTGGVHLGSNGKLEIWPDPWPPQSPETPHIPKIYVQAELPAARPPQLPETPHIPKIYVQAELPAEIPQKEKRSDLCCSAEENIKSNGQPKGCIHCLPPSK